MRGFDPCGWPLTWWEESEDKWQEMKSAHLSLSVFNSLKELSPNVKHRFSKMLDISFLYKINQAFKPVDAIASFKNNLIFDPQRKSYIL